MTAALHKRDFLLCTQAGHEPEMYVNAAPLNYGSKLSQMYMKRCWGCEQKQGSHTNDHGMNLSLSLDGYEEQEIAACTKSNSKGGENDGNLTTCFQKEGTVSLCVCVSSEHTFTI